MCGILTWLSFDNGATRSGFSRGLNDLAHRGPDAEGLFHDGGVMIGHRRLKIIDLSEEANQPMSAGGGRYWIAFNGEIYNFKELRDFLTSKGYRFKTTGDTEVLLKLYIELGHACLDRLNGMFSFVVYDRELNKLFAARDRMGIKPLYYCWDGSRFAAASEIRSLLSARLADRQIDHDAVIEYLSFGAVQAPRTMIKNVKALLPGHFICVVPGNLSVQKYWSPPFIPEEEKQPETVENAAETIRELLESAVRLRMISDVPLGTFLSGGIDSSAITAIMAGSNVSEVKTFSIGYDTGCDAFNETSYAKQVAETFGTEHREFILTGQDVVSNLDNVIRHMDQPTIDGLNTYFVSKFAREHVTVCLSGTGSDELFAGYPSAKILCLSSLLNRFTPPVPARIGTIMRGIFDRLPDRYRKKLMLRGLFSALGAWPSHYDRYLLACTIFNSFDLNRLMIGPNGSSPNGSESHVDEVESLSPVDATCFFDQTVYLRNTLLRDIDAMSMAHSLEVRVPFLDYRLVEYTAQLPASVKYDLKKPKALLARSMKDILPKEILNRKKMGFCFPLGVWLQSSGLKDVMADCFSGQGLPRRGLFSSVELDRLYRSGLHADFSSPRFLKQYSKLWALSVLELWMRETLDSTLDNTSHFQSRSVDDNKMDRRKRDKATVGSQKGIGDG